MLVLCSATSADVGAGRQAEPVTHPDVAYEQECS